MSMRQTCPHCSANFTVAEDKITGSWAFSKCPVCSGMSVIVNRAGAKLPIPPRPERPVSHPILEPPPLPVAKTELFPAPPPLPKSEEQLSLEQFENDVSLAQQASSRPVSSLRTIAPFVVLFAISLTLYLLSGNSDHRKRSAVAEAQRITGTQSQARAAQQAVPAQASAQVAVAPQSLPAMQAPQSPPAGAARPPRLFVEVAVETAVLRSGPGIAFRRVGVAQQELRLLVKNWKQDWFEVQAAAPGQEELQTAWIRNDLVKPIIEEKDL